MFLDVIDYDKPDPRWATLYQLVQVALAGYDLFCAALAHPDATEEVLQEIREQCSGPIVDAARGEMSGSVWRRDQQTGEMNEEPAEYPY